MQRGCDFETTFPRFGGCESLLHGRLNEGLDGVPLRQDPLLDRLEQLRGHSQSKVLGYSSAVVSVAAAVGARFLFGDVLAIGTFITFYPAVILTATLGRWWPGVLSIVLSLLAADYFFIPPIGSLSVTPGQLAALLVFAFNLTCVVAVISVLHVALDRHAQREGLLRTLLETEPAGLIGIDGMGSITFINRMGEEYFGYERSQLMGRRIEVLLPERFREAHIKQLAAFMRSPSIRAMGAGRDLFGLRSDGKEFPIEVGLSPTKRNGDRGALATVVDISARKKAEQRERILVHEVQHRARNLLAVVQALAMRTFVPTRMPLASRAIFLDALGALSRTQDLYMNEGEVLLRRIIERETHAFGTQVTISGPDIRLNSNAAQNFSLIVHELCTNAAKHGALSAAEGRLAVKWHQSGDELEFSWVECGGPPVKQPRGAGGFGRWLLADLAGAFGKPSFNYAEAGFEYALRAKLAAIEEIPKESAAIVA